MRFYASHSYKQYTVVITHEPETFPLSTYTTDTKFDQKMFKAFQEDHVITLLSEAPPMNRCFTHKHIDVILFCILQLIFDFSPI